MKTNPVLRKAMVFGTVGAAALLAHSAQAQFNAARGNLILGAVKNPAGSFDMVVDLGANDAYQAYTGVAAPNQAARLLGGVGASGTYGGVTVANENRFTSSDLLSVLGGDLNNVLFSVSGIDSEASPTANSTFFMTRARTDVNTQSTPINRASAFSQGGTGNVLDAPRANAVANGIDFNNTSTKEDVAGLNSYSVKIPPAGYTDMENNTGGSFGSGGIARSDLYYVAPGTGAADFLGYFELQGNGDLWFIPENFVPVPEAGAYGLLAGAGLLIVALRRQMVRKTA